MTVEARLGSAVSPALPVVNVEVELKVDHFSTKLNESAGMIVHRTRKEKGRYGPEKGREGWCRWGWDEEELRERAEVL